MKKEKGEYFIIRDFKIPYKEELQGILTKEEKDCGCVATDINIWSLRKEKK